MTAPGLPIEVCLGFGGFSFQAQTDLAPLLKRFCALESRNSNIRRYENFDGYRMELHDGKSVLVTCTSCQADATHLYTVERNGTRSQFCTRCHTTL